MQGLALHDQIMILLFSSFKVSYFFEYVWKIISLSENKLICIRVRCNENFSCKVCSINFEPPDIDLCSACHVYPISRGASIISILFIVNRFTWGVELDNLMDTLKHLFDLSPSNLSLSVKSQPNVNRLGPKGFNSQRKIVQTI